jgi:glycolate oxidase iron-sulfur subunit
MQTNFTLTQLADPDIADSERILRACVHCGFCTATCPTYVLLGDELDSPRGRIYLIKDMLEGAKPASDTVVKHLDRCLSCLACMTTCPSDVNYMHLVDHARGHIERTFCRPVGERLFRTLLALLLPRPALFRYALLAAMVGRPLVPGRLVRILPARWRRAMELAPWSLPLGSASDRPQVFTARGVRRLRVGLLRGCVQRVLAPDINEATVRMLTRLGCEVVVSRGVRCCGALAHHLGKTAPARAQALANVAAWSREIEDGGLDAIVVNASGCGTMVKDYGHLLRETPAWADRAARISELACDVTELVDRLQPPAAETKSITVAYHAACSLRHGQGIDEQPKRLLAAAGFTVREALEGHLCCGSAGTYNLLQPELAQRLLDRKIGNIETLAPTVIATGNIGCITQLATATAIPVVHTIELLDWAHGGPKPRALGH